MITLSFFKENRTINVCCRLSINRGYDHLRSAMLIRFGKAPHKFLIYRTE